MYHFVLSTHTLYVCVYARACVRACVCVCVCVRPLPTKSKVKFSESFFLYYLPPQNLLRENVRIALIGIRMTYTGPYNNIAYTHTHTFSLQTGTFTALPELPPRKRKRCLLFDIYFCEFRNMEKSYRIALNLFASK